MNIQRFRIVTLFTFWDMRTLDLQNACLQIYRNNRIPWKVAYFLRKLQTFRANNFIILRIQNAKFSGYYFHRNTNIWRDFQICISVSLINWGYLKRAYFFLFLFFFLYNDVNAKTKVLSVIHCCVAKPRGFLIFGFLQAYKLNTWLEL